MENFANWQDLPEEALGSAERKLFYGEKIMLVRNNLHPHAGIPSHAHPHEQLLHCVAGAFDVTICDKTEHLTAGGVAWVPSNVPHAVVNTEDTPSIVVDIFSPIREDFLKK